MYFATLDYSISVLLSAWIKFFKIFFDLGSLQTIRRVFDTDKLAFTELLGVPNGIRGAGFHDRRAPHSCCPGMLLEIGSFSGVYFLYVR